MSFMKGDLLTKTRKLVKGLAKAEPVWYKAMEQFVSLSPFSDSCSFCAVYVIMMFWKFHRAPPPTFPRADAIQRITLPEDVYIKKFFKKHPDSKHEDAIKYGISFFFFANNIPCVCPSTFHVLSPYQCAVCEHMSCLLLINDNWVLSYFTCGGLV